MLSTRKRLRIEQAIGVAVLRCWSCGASTYGFETADRRGLFDAQTGIVEWLDETPAWADLFAVEWARFLAGIDDERCR